MRDVTPLVLRWTIPSTTSIPFNRGKFVTSFLRPLLPDCSSRINQRAVDSSSFDSKHVIHSSHYLRTNCARSPVPGKYHRISRQFIEAMTAVCPVKFPEVGERMVILRLGMSIVVLN